MLDHATYKTALAELDRLTSHTDECDRDNDDSHTIHDYALRDVILSLKHDPDAPHTHDHTTFNDGTPLDVDHGSSQLTWYENLDDRLLDCENDAERAAFATLWDLISTIISYPYSRDKITELAVADSVCPLHFCDWMACFDDDDPECAQIRLIYPCSHDT